MMKRKDRACLCKRRYSTEQEALASIQRSGVRLPLYAYNCRYCGQWHISKRKPQT